MGRVKKYENDEEAKQIQKEQIRKSNQKYQAERKAFRKEAFNEQLLLVKLLNKYVIKDKEFLSTTLEKVKVMIAPPEPEEKKKEEEKKPEEKNPEEKKEKNEKKKIEIEIKEDV
jgi:hypothetical protein